jgi:inosine-uridine nucleoside N-ribohydrolase
VMKGSFSSPKGLIVGLMSQTMMKWLSVRGVLMGVSTFRAIALGALIVASGSASAQDARGPQKIIFDTDFNLFGDDGQALILAAQAHAAGQIQILGMTLVAGNTWIEEQRPIAAKAVERVGLEADIPVFAGADRPLLHSQASFEEEKALLGVGDGYYGAWSHPRPESDADVELSPDGAAQRTKVQEKHAVDFIIETVRANPGLVTILAIGPLTNIALAIRKAPDIVPLIKRIVYMGGAFDVPGNTMPAAEFNVWFDPDAAKIVYREPIEQIFIPLDVTNSARLDSGIFERIWKANPVIAKIDSRATKSPNALAPKFVQFWDQLAVAYVVDPTLATNVETRWIDVETTFGVNYGRTMSYAHEFPRGHFLQQAKIVNRFDLRRFEDYLVSTMSKPLPVRSKNKP